MKGTQLPSLHPLWVPIAAVSVESNPCFAYELIPVRLCVSRNSYSYGHQRESDSVFSSILASENSSDNPNPNSIPNSSDNGYCEETGCNRANDGDGGKGFVLIWWNPFSHRFRLQPPLAPAPCRGGE